MTDGENETPDSTNSQIAITPGEDVLLGEPKTSPVPGMDLPTFKNYLTRALNGDAGVPAVILGMVNAARVATNSPEERERRGWQDLLIWQAAENNLRRLHDLIETKHVEREQLLADIRDEERQLGTFDRHSQGHERAKNYRRLHGDFERNERGELADTDAEDMLRAWEKRTGRSLDHHSAEDIQDALRDQQHYEDAEAQRLERNLELKRERAQKLDTEIGELEAAESKARAALDNGADPQAINMDMQRQLIAKGHGTDEQKRTLAEAQGIELATADNVARATDDFDGPSIASKFGQSAGSTQRKLPEVARDNASPPSPIKPPAL